MEIRILNAEDMTPEQFRCFAEIERGLRRSFSAQETLMQELTKYTVFGFFDSGKLAAFLSVQPDSRYFGGSVYLRRICYDWMHNNEKTISALIRAAAEQYGDSMLVMDIHRQHELNRGLYCRLGFADSIMKSPLGRENVVLVASAQRILSGEEKRN